MRNLTSTEVEQVAGGIVGSVSLPFLGELPAVGGLVGNATKGSREERVGTIQASSGPVDALVGMFTGII